MSTPQNDSFYDIYIRPPRCGETFRVRPGEGWYRDGQALEVKKGSGAGLPIYYVDGLLDDIGHLMVNVRYYWCYSKTDRRFFMWMIALEDKGLLDVATLACSVWTTKHRQGFSTENGSGDKTEPPWEMGPASGMCELWPSRLDISNPDDPRIDELKRIARPFGGYQKYLNSPHWHKIRSRALKYYGEACMLCGRHDRVNVHHRHYRSVGKEELSDLSVLCKGCHGRFHGKE